MKRLCLLLALSLTMPLASYSQTTAPSATSAPSQSAGSTFKRVEHPKRPSFEQSMAKARKLKARRDYEGAELALWDAMAVNWKDARPYYMMGWIAIAEKDRSEAIYHFRTALKAGLTGKEALEARAALKRMGVSEQFPKIKRRPLSITQRLTNQMLMADIFKPSPGEWAMQTALAIALAAVGWALTMLVMSWASRQKFGKFDLKVIAFFCLTLLLLRVAGQFFVSFRHILPLTLAYLALSVGLFLAALGYGMRRLATKKVMDKGGIVAWGTFYSLLFLLFAGGASSMGPYFMAVATIALGLWLVLNPWYFTSQKAEKLKKKGDIKGAVELMERFIEKPRLSDKTRFALLNDLASNYLALNEPQKTIGRANDALRYVHAFKSAEVLPRVNLAEAYGMMGRTEEAVDQLSQVWHLTETQDCIMSNQMWQGTVHGILASTNYWRGWLDEAERQADLCIEAFPVEQRSGTTAKNLVAMSRAIKGAARLATGDLETAHKYVAAAPKLGPVRGALAFVQFVTSQVHEASGQIEEAKSLAWASLEASPGFFPAQLQIADLMAQSGDKAMAIDMLQQALPANSGHHLAGLAVSKLRSWGGRVPLEIDGAQTSASKVSESQTSSVLECTTI